MINQVAIELSEYDISYMPRTTIKAQALADFVSEMIGTTQEEVPKARPWLLYVDDSSTAQGSGAGIVLTNLQGDDMEFAVKLEFKASNNKTEYEALVLGMRMAQDAGASHLLAYSDSQLVVRQVNGEYEIKEESMVQYLHEIEELKTRCLSQEEGLHVVNEIHDGCCGSHVGTWALANKALRAGYFWPTMKQDARYLVNKCEKCQKHATLIHQPA
ncbi:UNVERIFIED_CONTAM: hypothetical protein Sradi_6915300 [Sesamum radiatum]|uniref:RNase H type-1 domain-containing protein n=1 Tax=Sesamum radiatum TaxID=300843 RepID=A0AAW2JH65_SESRA